MDHNDHKLYEGHGDHNGHGVHNGYGVMTDTEATKGYNNEFLQTRARVLRDEIIFRYSKFLFQLRPRSF